MRAPCALPRVAGDNPDNACPPCHSLTPRGNSSVRRQLTTSVPTIDLLMKESGSSRSKWGTRCGICNARGGREGERPRNINLVRLQSEGRAGGGGWKGEGRISTLRMSRVSLVVRSSFKFQAQAIYRPWPFSPPPTPNLDMFCIVDYWTFMSWCGGHLAEFASKLCC